MNENLPSTTNQNEFTSIAIPEEKINLVAALADENAMWVKLTDGGFLVNGEKVVSELKGILAAINPYWIKWEEKRPTKIPYNGQDAPEGFELRCDIKMDIDGTVIGLSLPKTSTKLHLSQYLKFLKNSGLNPNQVITRVRSKAISSPHGRFNVAIFDAVGDIGEQKPITHQVGAEVIDVPTIKTAPRPVQASSNPWA